MQRRTFIRAGIAGCTVALAGCGFPGGGDEGGEEDGEGEEGGEEDDALAAPKDSRE